MRPRMSDPEGGGLKSFAIMVAWAFAVIVLLVVALAIFMPDSGLLPFAYEGA